MIRNCLSANCCEQNILPAAMSDIRENYIADQGRIQDFHGGGGGAAQKITCAHAHHHEREARSAFIAVGFFILSRAILVFLSILIQNEILKKHSQSNFRGGGVASDAPPLNSPLKTDSKSYGVPTRFFVLDKSFVPVTWYSCAEIREIGRWGAIWGCIGR